MKITFIVILLLCSLFTMAQATARPADSIAPTKPDTTASVADTILPNAANRKQIPYRNPTPYRNSNIPGLYRSSVTSIPYHTSAADIPYHAPNILTPYPIPEPFAPPYILEAYFPPFPKPYFHNYLAEGSFNPEKSLTNKHYGNPDTSNHYRSPDTSGPRHWRNDTFVVRKRFWRGAAELFLVELIPWSYNYFIRDADFAHITWSSIWYNLQPKNWEWDDNSFKTNQFAHPYHGNLYYNSFRNNGYNFWQSVPAAFVGSFLWEVAGETHPPAPNDFINTSLGGISLGEMTYRMSNVIINDGATGFKRQMQEVFGFLVNPVGGLNRILDGRWGRVHYNPADTIKHLLSGVFDIGVRRFSLSTKDVFEKGDNEFFMRLRLQYGDPDLPTKIPFSNFSIVVEAGASDSAYLNTVQVNGALQQWVLKENHGNRHMAAITMNYDYFHNTAFEYGGQSFNFKILSKWNTGSHFQLRTMLGAGAIVLGAVPDDYLYYGEGRNYDYGPGVSITAGATAVLNDKLLCNINYTGGWFWTVNGNDASFFLNTAAAEFRYLFGKNISMALQVGHYGVNGNYSDYPDVNKKYPFFRFSVGYKLF